MTHLRKHPDRPVKGSLTLSLCGIGVGLDATVPSGPGCPRCRDLEARVPVSVPSTPAIDPPPVAAPVPTPPSPPPQVVKDERGLILQMLPDEFRAEIEARIESLNAFTSPVPPETADAWLDPKTPALEMEVEGIDIRTLLEGGDGRFLFEVIGIVTAMVDRGMGSRLLGVLDRSLRCAVAAGSAGAAPQRNPSTQKSEKTHITLVKPRVESPDKPDKSDKQVPRKA